LEVQNQKPPKENLNPFGGFTRATSGNLLASSSLQKVMGQIDGLNGHMGNDD
jgi:hypothetical protein